MNRLLAFICSLLIAFVAVSSACVAQSADWIRFTLEPEHGNSAKIHASFRDGSRAHAENSWSTGFAPSELVGLDASSFHSPGTRSIRFAIMREAGRLDCLGNGGNDHADGNCRFTADPGFTQLLMNRGIGRPRREQAFALMAVNARREMVDALAAAHYPTPTIDQLIPLAAVGVNGPYVAGLARLGDRPRSIDSLIQFRALNITPEWISDFVRIGYANLPPDQLVQLKALNITPEFIGGFERIGYRNLPVDTLVQLKAMNITPEFVRAVQRGNDLPSPDRLVQLRALSRQLRRH